MSSRSLPMSFRMSFIDHPIFDIMVEDGVFDKVGYTVTEYSGEQKKEFDDFVFNHTPLKHAPAHVLEDYLHDIGEIELNMSGCINACGHHHVGNIGILGVDKDGSEWYQVSIGGAQGNDSAIAKIIGPSFSAGQMPEVIDRIIQVYLRERVATERFIDTAQRLGIAPFKEFVYATPVTTTLHHGEDAGSAVSY